MEGSSNCASSGINSNEKIPSPPQQLLQPHAGVPSIFLGPADGSTSSNNNNNQTPQTSTWAANAGAGGEAQRDASGSTDSYKMKTCASTQCGNNGYEGVSSSIAVGGGQPPPQNRVYPPYIQQQQIAVPIRSMHQHHHHHHHHHGIAGPCHPHQQQQSQSGISVAPHLERMMHGGTSAVAVAAAQQMRSMVMSQYPSNSGAYPHQSTTQSAPTFYPQPVTTPAGNGPFIEYNHPHNGHHHHGHGISAATAAMAVQYAHQQQHHQRLTSLGAAALNPYRQLPVHNHQKVINSSQAAAAYQSAYQQHQYSQYMHHHHPSMIPSHSHPHHHHQNGAGGTTGGVLHQRMLGIPMPTLQQQQQQAFINRSGQHIPHLHQQQHHSQGFSLTCQPQPPMARNYVGASQHPQHHQQLVNSMVAPNSADTSSINANATTAPNVDLNNNCTSSKSMGSSSEIPGTKSISQKSSPETLIVNHKSHHSSMKVNSIKLSHASPEKSIKIKASKSVTKLRDRQPRLVVGQKKKSTGNVGSSSSSRKLKSLKALSAAVSSGVTVENLHSCGKRLTSFLVDTDGNGDLKRSRKAAKAEDASVIEKQSESAPEASPEECEKKTSVEETVPVEEISRPAPDKFYVNLEENNEDEYKPTPEELQKYLERLNTCHDLNLPHFYAYSVFHGKLSKSNIRSSRDSSGTTKSTTEGTYTRTTTSTIPSVLYHHNNQSQEYNFTTFLDWDSSAISAAEEVYNNFQDDMAVLEAYFPLLSTMEQSERAEKLDVIYTYEGQMKLMNSSSPDALSGSGNEISPPCSCVQETEPCSCCYNFMIPASMGSPEGCGNLDEHINHSFNGDSSPQFVIDPSFHHLPQPHYVSTPLSSRRGYSTGAPFQEQENSYLKANSTRNRLGARKRSSSYPSRKSGRRSSGSRDHLKSETESFLDELISTANDEKLSKQKNTSGEITAPEIQCEVDFPSLESSTAVCYSKRQAKKSKGEEGLSARDGYLGSSSVTTEENESNTSACSSSTQSTHNTSSEGDFDGGSEITLIGGGRLANHKINSKTSHPILLPSTCRHYEHDSGACCSTSEHLWDDFRGDELVAMQSDSFGSTVLGGTSCVPMANLNHLISHCTCTRHVDPICPTRPPPGFEHLARPAFPIDLYDPSLLGSLIGGQLPGDVLSSLDSSALSRKQFEEMEELLQSLTCCEKHAVDKMLYSRRSSSACTVDEDELHDDSDDEWESLEKAIKTVLNEWTQELHLRKRMRDFLFSLNLHDVYGGCCKNVIPLDPGELDNINTSFNSGLLSSKEFSTASPTQESTPVFLQGDMKL